jgi:hypothetical protein
MLIYFNIILEKPCVVDPIITKSFFLYFTTYFKFECGMEQPFYYRI